MALLKDKKQDYYAMKQNLRDEAGALDHLESAGDALIRDLARKQTVTKTSLREQLEIRQEFEKGTELQPWNQSGLTTLEKFQDATISYEPSTSKKSESGDAERIKSRSGLSRHELELGLVEKPGSQTSVLYRFALGNRKAKPEKDDLVSKLERHPLNRLKEIEEEMFANAGVTEEGEPERKMKRRKKRKRVRKRKEAKPADGEKPKEPEVGRVEDGSEESSEAEDVASYRPSLWDVKDMRKFCKNEQQGCQIPKLYTIRDGKIVQVNAESKNTS